MTPTYGYTDAIRDEIAIRGRAGFVLAVIGDALMFAGLVGLLLASVIVLWAAVA